MNLICNKKNRISAIFFPSLHQLCSYAAIVLRNSFDIFRISASRSNFVNSIHFFSRCLPNNQISNFLDESDINPVWKRANNNTIFKSYLASGSRRRNIFFFWFPSFVFENHSRCCECHFAWLLSISLFRFYFWIDSVDVHCCGAQNEYGNWTVTHIKNTRPK